MSSSSNARGLSSNTPDIPTGMPKKAFIGDPMGGANEFRDQVPQNMMVRPAFSKAGKPATIQVNSHIVEQWPTRDVFQYDVSRSADLFNR